jgi:hypothetical protein
MVYSVFLKTPRLGPKVGIRLLHVDIGLTPPKWV